MFHDTHYFCGGGVARLNECHAFVAQPSSSAARQRTAESLYPNDIRRAAYCLGVSSSRRQGACRNSGEPFGRPYLGGNESVCWSC
jgi:hypothetical protein